MVKKRRSNRVRRPVWGDRYKDLQAFLIAFCDWTKQEKKNVLLYIDERRGLSHYVLRPESRLRVMPNFLGIANSEGKFKFFNE